MFWLGLIPLLSFDNLGMRYLKYIKNKKKTFITIQSIIICVYKVLPTEYIMCSTTQGGVEAAPLIGLDPAPSLSTIYMKERRLDATLELSNSQHPRPTHNIAVLQHGSLGTPPCLKVNFILAHKF